MPKTWNLVAFVLWAGAGLWLAGCSYKPPEIRYPESGAKLSGTVSYGKDRVFAALVIAQNAHGAATAFVDEEGHYELKNVPLGEVLLGVNTAAGRGQATGKLMAQAQGKAKGRPRVVEVPGRFADPAKSGITTSVKEGENTFDVVIPK